MNKSESKEATAAPTFDKDVLGRLSALQAQGSENADLLRQLQAQVKEGAAAIERMVERFGELSVSAPRTPAAEQVPLSRQEIEDRVKTRPQASFRLLSPVNFPDFAREKGAIVRPQVIKPSIWAALLQMRVPMADADENP